MKTYEEIKALKIRKGSQIKFTSGGRAVYEGTVRKVYNKKSYSGRDNGKQYYEFSLTNVLINGQPSKDILEGHFDELEKIK